MLEIYKPEINTELLNKYQLEHVKIGRDSWHEYFISQAFLISTRSKDAQTKFGAVFVDSKNHIISAGYNSFVRNIDDENLSNIRPNKYQFMIHAEHNGILSAARRGTSLNKSSCYVTGRPCINCIQFMYQAGVKKVYYAEINSANMCVGDKDNFDLIVSLMSDDIQLIKIDSPELLRKISLMKNIFS